MNAYTALVSGVLFPLQERAKGHHSVALRRRLERSQWLAPDAIEAERVARLRAFLVTIGQRVPYYSELFRSSGFDPAALRAVHELAALPLLTKDIIRARSGDLKAAGHGPISRYNTGGSSGQPLVFYIGKDRKSHDIWVEVWNHQRQAWQLVDIYNNLYFTQSDGETLSALQLRSALLANAPDLQLDQLFPGPRQAYRSEAPVWAYMRRGLDQWYLVWGKSGQTYGQAMLVRAFGVLSRSLAQLGGTVQGACPDLRALPTPTNRQAAQALQVLRWQLMGVAVVVPAALLAALALLWRARARSPGPVVFS